MFIINGNYDSWSSSHFLSFFFWISRLSLTCYKDRHILKPVLGQFDRKLCHFASSVPIFLAYLCTILLPGKSNVWGRHCLVPWICSQPTAFHKPIMMFIILLTFINCKLCIVKHKADLIIKVIKSWCLIHLYVLLRKIRTVSKQKLHEYLFLINHQCLPIMNFSFAF